VYVCDCACVIIFPLQIALGVVLQPRPVLEYWREYALCAGASAGGLQQPGAYAPEMVMILFENKNIN